MKCRTTSLWYCFTNKSVTVPNPSSGLSPFWCFHSRRCFFCNIQKQNSGGLKTLFFFLPTAIHFNQTKSTVNILYFLQISTSSSLNKNTTLTLCFHPLSLYLKCSHNDLETYQWIICRINSEYLHKCDKIREYCPLLFKPTVCGPVIYYDKPL